MAAIIFDFDGTIANSFNFVADFLALGMSAEPLSEVARKELGGMSMYAMARHLGYRRWRLPGLFFKGRRHMGGGIKDLEPFDGMPQLIRQLHDDGHKLYLLSSNNSRNIQVFLKAYDLDKYFIKIYGSVGLFSKAPALRRLLRKHHLERASAVYIGDELRDSEAAQSINLRIISVSWGFARRADLEALKPTALVDTPAELAVAISKI